MRKKSHNLLLRRGILKKIVISSTVLIITIIAPFMLLRINPNDSISVNTAEGIENPLVKSMEESKTEKKELEQFLTKSSQELNDNGYEKVGLSYSDQNLTIQVQDKAFLEANKKNIEKIIYYIAKEFGFQDFKIDFLTLDSYPTISEEDEKLRESMMSAFEEIASLLKEKGYDYNSISTNSNNEIIIEIQGTNVDLDKSVEIEELIAQKILSKSNIDLDVKLQKISESTVRDQEWQPIFEAIRVETEKKFEEYRGFAYSFHPEPLQIIIKTDLDTPKWFWNSNKKVNQITEYVDKIIELKREELSIKELPYEIIIRDKNNKKMK